MKKEIRIEKCKNALRTAYAKYGNKSSKTIQLRIKLNNLKN